MANGSTEWKVVSRKHRTRPRLAASHVTGVGEVPEPDSPELVRRILRTREELRGSQFWTNCRDVITQAWENMMKEENASQIPRGDDQIADGAQFPSVLCLGLGPFASCYHARCQLAFLLLLEAELKAPTSVFDPIFSTVECETLCRLGFHLIPMNKEGRHPISGPTLAVLVHCGKALCNNFLWANWSPNNLARILLLSNSFEMLHIRTPNRVLQRDYVHISQVLDIVEEASLDSQCPSSLPIAEAFSDTSLHSFPMASLCTRSMAFWENCPPPFYLDLDEPELVRDIQKLVI
uniref:SRR1-like protein isoform X1 n=1 Tax=Myxine glutinosa TaxID=7769 RepID=UPI00358DE2E7